LQQKGIEFDFSGDTTEAERPWDFSWALQNTLKQNYDEQTSIDYKIKKQLENRRKRGVVDDDIDDDDDDDGEEENKSMQTKKNKKVKTSKIKKKKEEKVQPNDTEEEDGEGEGNGEVDSEPETDQIKERAHKPTKKQKEFFEKSETEGFQAESFLDLHLSRPLLKAVANLGYSRPTPVQSQAIPIALQGKDVCASATTGSGKTAAFVLPILERLIHRDKRIMATRVIILTPTRELAIQCHSVVEKLAKFTDITACLVVGGLSNKVQEAALRRHPDIVIATPGRIIDHLRNAQSFTLETVDILVLDEADRLLSLGFSEELEQIIRFCPESRQTLLFSATMTEKVDQLAALSLNRPVRVRLDPTMRVATGVHQEFVKVKPSREQDRDAMLLALCTRSFKTRSLIFFKAKKEAHRLKVIFGLAGLKAAELHGNLTQNQRLEALEKFRDGEFDFLLATDLAARGLDIMGIETIVNYNMTRTVESYIHRVGRTARWGHSGRSVTFIGEQDRKALKEILKITKQKVANRVIPAKVIDQWRTRIDSMKEDISHIFRMEYEEKQLRLAQMQTNKTLNMIQHEGEIFSRPPRTWFQTKEQKNQAKEQSAKEQFGESEAEPEEEDTRSSSKNWKKGVTKDEKKLQFKIKRDELAGLSRQQKRRKLQEKAIKKWAGEEEMEKQTKQSISARHAKKKDRALRGGKLVDGAKPEKRGQKRARSDGSGSRFDSDLLQPKRHKSSTPKTGVDDNRRNKSGNGPVEKKPLGKKHGKHQFKSKKRYQRKK